ncbi:MAG: TraB/GumN family protein [Bacteriovoracia bacterium]
MRLFWLTFLTLISCATTDKSIDRPFLYEVSKGSERGYFFGTVHVNVAARDLPANFWRYFNLSDAFVAEVDMTKQIPLIERGLQQRMFRSGEDTPLRDGVRPKTYQLLEKYLYERYPKKAQEMLDRFTLMGVYAFLLATHQKEVHIKNELESFEGGRIQLGSLDQELTERAIIQKKSILTLDELESESFISCSIYHRYGAAQDYEKNILTLLSDSPHKIDRDPFIRLMNAYRSGNENFFRREQTARGCLLEGRNEQWMNKIKFSLRQYKRPFIAVGLYHLEHSGETVLKMLMREGYKVRRLRF